MNESNIKSETEEINTSKKDARISKISMWMGLLAVLPYVSFILGFLILDLGFNSDLEFLQSIGGILAGPAFFVVTISGIPFGLAAISLAAIITGAISLTRKPKIKRNVIYAYIGIIFGIGGFIGLYWFSVTCPFCQ